MKKNILILSMFTILFFISCGKKEVSQTQNVLEAKVTMVIGNAYIFRVDNPEKVKVSIGMRLNPSDILVTEKNSTVNVTLPKRGILKIKENSQISFKELLVIDEENDSLKIKITSGKVITGLKKLAKESSFRIETPTAVAGVRGTTFMVSVSKDENSAFPYFIQIPKEEKIVTKIGVLTGKVEFINPQNPDEKVMVETLREATLINDDFKNLKIEKISKLTLDEIKEIKELSEIKELKLNEISDEIKSVEVESETLLKKEVKTKTSIKSKTEDLSGIESTLEKEKIESKTGDLLKKEKIKKGTGKYLEDESGF